MSMCRFSLCICIVPLQVLSVSIKIQVVLKESSKESSLLFDLFCQEMVHDLPERAAEWCSILQEITFFLFYLFSFFI